MRLLQQLGEEQASFEQSADSAMDQLEEELQTKITNLAQEFQGFEDTVTHTLHEHDQVTQNIREQTERVTLDCCASLILWPICR